MNWVLNLAVVAAATLIIASTKADAAVVDITEGSTSGYTMTDGNTYVIQNSVSFSNSMVGGSGMTVEEGAMVVLYVPAGVTLTARGAVGTNGANGGSFVSVTGGGAGIRVPETATLIITGEGIINTSGGNAGNGGRGGNGGSGSLTPIRGGVGGYGGQGGGGAGAGIGGCGGAGGSGGETMGNVYILGSMNINAEGGVALRAKCTDPFRFSPRSGKEVELFIISCYTIISGAPLLYETTLPFGNHKKEAAL